MADGTQIAMTYDTGEDRILMRYPATGREVRLWITRRMAQRWLGATAKVFDHVQGTGAAPEEQRRAVSQFQRESAVQGADFSKPYEPPPPEEPESDAPSAPPSGSPEESPLLVRRLTITAHKDGKLRLELGAGGHNAEKVALTLTQRELHGLTHMLTLSAQKAEWGLTDPSLPAARRGGPPIRAN